MVERTFICEGCRRELLAPGSRGKLPRRCDGCSTDASLLRLASARRENERLRAEAVVAAMRERERGNALRGARRSATMAERKRDAALEEVRQLRAELRKASHATGEVMAVVRGRSDPIRRGQPDANTWQEVIPDHKLRARKIGEPGRDALLKAIRLVRFAEGARGTAEALLDLAAVCVVWAENLTATEHASPVTRGQREAKRAA